MLYMETEAADEIRSKTMKIIDAHLHFVPENPYFQEIAVRAEHKNTEEDLRAVYQKYNIEGGVVMGNRGVAPGNHSYPEFLKYCVGIDRDFLASTDKKKSLDQVEKNLKKGACVGIKLYPGYNKAYVTDEVYEPVYDLAKAYEEEGRKEEALSLYETLVKSECTETLKEEVYSQKIRLELELDKKEQAKATFEEGKKAFPESEILKQYEERFKGEEAQKNEKSEEISGV